MHSKKKCKKMQIFPIFLCQFEYLAEFCCRKRKKLNLQIQLI